MQNLLPSRGGSRSGLQSLGLVLVLAAGVISVPPVYADDDMAEDAQERTAVADSKLTLAQALETADKEFPGARVLKAEVDTENGVPSYVVEIEKDGVQRLVFDLKTGHMTKMAAGSDDRDSVEGDREGDDTARDDEHRDEDQEEESSD